MIGIIRRTVLGFVCAGSLFAGVAFAADPWADAVNDFLDHLDLFYEPIDDDLDDYGPSSDVGKHLGKARSHLEAVEAQFDAHGSVKGLRKSLKPLGQMVNSLGKAVTRGNVARFKGPAKRSAGLFDGCDGALATKSSVCVTASDILSQVADDAETMFETFDAQVRTTLGGDPPKRVIKKLDKARELFESGQQMLEGSLADPDPVVPPAKGHPVKKGLKKMFKGLKIMAAAMEKFPPSTNPGF